MGVFGWEYPPGVTGREPQIAGWPECPHCGEEFNGSDCDDCGFTADEYEPDYEGMAEARLEAREPPPGWEEGL